MPLLTSDMSSIHDLIAVVNEEMYRARRSGKNHVSIAGVNPRP